MERSKEKISQYITKYYQNCDHIEIANFREINIGWETKKYSLSVICREKSEIKEKRLLFRVFSGGHGVFRAENEYKIMKVLYELGYPVPQVLGVENKNSPFNEPFIIMPFIDGESMMSLIEKSESKQQNELLMKFLKLFVDLHELDWKNFQYMTKEIRTEDSTWFIERNTLLFDRMLQNYKSTQVLQPVVSWLKEKAPEITPIPLSLLHGDFHPDNIMIKDNGSVFVIDWGGALIGDRRFDLAWTILLATTYGFPIREVILNGYEQLTKRKIEDIVLFEVMAVIRRLSDYIISTSGDSLGMRSDVVQLMKKDSYHYLNVLEFLKEKTKIEIPILEREFSQ